MTQPFELSRASVENMYDSKFQARVKFYKSVLKQNKYDENANLAMAEIAREFNDIKSWINYTKACLSGNINSRAGWAHLHRYCTFKNDVNLWSQYVQAMSLVSNSQIYNFTLKQILREIISRKNLSMPVKVDLLSKIIRQTLHKRNDVGSILTYLVWLKIDDKNTNYRLALAQLYFRRGKYGNAKQHCVIALKYGPGDNETRRLQRLIDAFISKNLSNCIAEIKVSLSGGDYEDCKLLVRLATQMFADNEYLQSLFQRLDKKPADDNGFNEYINTFSRLKSFMETRDYTSADNVIKDGLLRYPEDIGLLNARGYILYLCEDLQNSREVFESVLKKHPKNVETLVNLSLTYIRLEQYDLAKKTLLLATSLDPNNSHAWNNLGIIALSAKDHQTAAKFFKKSFDLVPSSEAMLLNYCLSMIKLGRPENACILAKKAIEINPSSAQAFNNLGLSYLDVGDVKKAKVAFERSLKLAPDNPDPTWNIHLTERSLLDAFNWLDKRIELIPNDIAAICSRALIQHTLNDERSEIDVIIEKYGADPHVRSLLWLTNLADKPRIFFNRWDLFNYAISLAETGRAYYEFGVWTGLSFRYISKRFKANYGFDTFVGLPEKWHDEEVGMYSAGGAVPEIPNAQFVEGPFSETLPKFFSNPRPKAGLLNFDADLYSSTLLALENSKRIIDGLTIFVFDEFIVNEKWEQDEYKALNEFCDENGFEYKVLAASLSTKQVVVTIQERL